MVNVVLGGTVVLGSGCGGETRMGSICLTESGDEFKTCDFLLLVRITVIRLSLDQFMEIDEN
jgi:hypothetical protein